MGESVLSRVDSGRASSNPDSAATTKQGPTKKRTYRPRKRRVAVNIPDDEKLSPNSLRKTLIAIRQTADDGSPVTKVEFCKQLNERWQQRGPRYKIATISEKIFWATERNKAWIAYDQLEAYALRIEVPAALILLVSRLVSENEHSSDGVTSSAQDIVRGIRAMLDRFVAVHSSKTTFDDLDIYDLLNTYRLAVRNHGES